MDPILQHSSQKLDGAKSRLESHLNELRNTVNELNFSLEENKSVMELSEELPKRAKHSIIIPFGPQAFFLGDLVHTNEVFLALGEGYFSHRTFSNGVASTQRRNSFIQQKLRDAEEEINEIHKQLELIDEIEVKSLNEDTPKISSEEVLETPTPEFISKSKPKLDSNIGSLRKTPEGFYEICEEYSSESEDDSIKNELHSQYQSHDSSQGSRTEKKEHIANSDGSSTAQKASRFLQSRRKI